MLSYPTAIHTPSQQKEPHFTALPYKTVPDPRCFTALLHRGSGTNF